MTNEILTRTAEVLERSVTLENQNLAAELRRFDTAQREALAHAISGRSDAQEELVRALSAHDEAKAELARVEASAATLAAAGRAAYAERDASQAQLAEAMGLLRKFDNDLWPEWDDTGAQTALLEDVQAFLARAAQAEQQEAGPRLVSYSEEMATCTLNHQGREYYFTLDGRSDEEAQGAQAGDERIALLERELDRERERADMAEVELQHARAALATQPAAGEPVATWVALTAAGQLRKGDKIRFRFGQETLTETVALVLDAGTEREEIVYNRKRNFYFITSKALAGTSSAKEVEVLRTAAAPPAAAHGDSFRTWLAAEMPAGTVIGDPSWWAERILKRIGDAAHGDEAVRKDADDLLEPWDVLEALADGYERGYQDGQSKPKGYIDKLTKHRVAADLLAAMRAQSDGGSGDA